MLIIITSIFLIVKEKYTRRDKVFDFLFIFLEIFTDKGTARVITSTHKKTPC